MEPQLGRPLDRTPPTEDVRVTKGTPELGGAALRGPELPCSHRRLLGAVEVAGRYPRLDRIGEYEGRPLGSDLDNPRGGALEELRSLPRVSLQRDHLREKMLDVGKDNRIRCQTRRLGEQLLRGVASPRCLPFACRRKQPASARFAFWRE